MAFSLVLEKKNIKSNSSALFLTWLQQPHAMGTSPATGGFPKTPSPAWQDHLQPGDAQQQAQSRGSSLASSRPPRPPTQILAHLAIILP